VYPMNKLIANCRQVTIFL